MSKKKLFGKANMEGVPPEELVLAEAIANGQAHGMEFAIGSTGVWHNGTVFAPFIKAEGDPSKFCGCAIGHYVVGKAPKDADESAYGAWDRLTGYTGDRDGYVTVGNDRQGNRFCFDGVPDYHTGPAVDIGIAFAAYHIDSDEGVLPASVEAVTK